MEKYKKNLTVAAVFGIGIIGLMAFVFLKSADSVDKIMREADELKKKILKEQRRAASKNFIE